MNGGIIDHISRERGGIVLQVHGVGDYRHKVVFLKMSPSNYVFRQGDLVWWRGNHLRWEGQRERLFTCQHLEGVVCS